MMLPIYISILLPTRGRHESLLRCIDSLMDGDCMPDRTELLIGFDDDEGYTPDVQHPGVRAIVMPRFPTLAMKVNHLAGLARGRVLMNIPNDAVVTRKDWPDRMIRAAADNAVAYVFDQANPSVIALPILTREIVNKAGYYAFPLFPFWFTDTWWDEIADMGVPRVPVDIGLRLNLDTKGTQGLRDLAFWVDVFDKTKVDRQKAAEMMLGSRIMPLCAPDRLKHLREDDALRSHYERNAESIADPRYKEAVALAKSYLQMRH